MDCSYSHWSIHSLMCSSIYRSIYPFVHWFSNRLIDWVLQSFTFECVYFTVLFMSLHLSVFSFLKPRREAGDAWCLPPVWNLRAVIWFHFAISSLVLLPSPVTLSVLSFSACWTFLLNFFQKILQYFSLRDRLFCMAPV